MESQELHELDFLKDRLEDMQAEIRLAMRWLCKVHTELKGKPEVEAGHSSAPPQAVIAVPREHPFTRGAILAVSVLVLLLALFGLMLPICTVLLRS